MKQTSKVHFFIAGMLGEQQNFIKFATCSSEHDILFAHSPLELEPRKVKRAIIYVQRGLC